MLFTAVNTTGVAVSRNTMARYTSTFTLFCLAAQFTLLCCWMFLLMRTGYHMNASVFVSITSPTRARTRKHTHTHNRCARRRSCRARPSGSFDQMVSTRATTQERLKKIEVPRTYRKRKCVVAVDGALWCTPGLSPGPPGLRRRFPVVLSCACGPGLRVVPVSVCNPSAEEGHQSFCRGGAPTKDLGTWLGTSACVDVVKENLCQNQNNGVVGFFFLQTWSSSMPGSLD